MPVADLSLEALQAWGESLGRTLEPPRLLTLSGDLGAGKTTLAQAICRGYGATGAVTSPTFALVHEYRAPRSPVYHLDLYRLRGAHELANIGWEDILGSGGLVLVEWPERAGGELPASRVDLTLEHVAGAGDVRRLTW
jgi:tRNA threonylcarbamoyl adenosine modification protein YjeE